MGVRTGQHVSTSCRAAGHAQIPALQFSKSADGGDDGAAHRSARVRPLNEREWRGRLGLAGVQQHLNKG